MNGDDKVRGPQSGRTVVGDTCEAHVARLLGARRWPDWPLLPVPRTVARDDDGDDFLLRPDLFWPAETALVEVKAGIAKFYVTVVQHAAYGWLRDHGVGPVRQPRVYYAFVAYRTERKVGARRSVRDLEADVVNGIRFVLVLDSRLVDVLAADFGSHGRDWTTPLSPMLGKWRDHYFFTPGKLEWLLSASRDDLTGRFGGGIRRTAINSGPPAVIIGIKRRSRRWLGPLPFEQQDLFDPNRQGFPLDDLDTDTV